MEKQDEAIDHGCEKVDKSSARTDQKHHVEHDDRAISTAISDQKAHLDNDNAIEEEN